MSGTTVFAHAPVALPNGTAVAIDALESGVLLETFDPQTPQATLLSETLSYEQYAQLRADNPGIAYPELSKPDPDSQGGGGGKEAAQQGRIHPNGYPQPGPVANTNGIIVPKTETAAQGAGSNPSGGAETEAEQGWWKSWGSGVLHGALDIAGLLPGLGEIADLANAAIYAAEGDYANAGISAAAAIPFAGWGATAAKAGKRVGDAVDASRTAKAGAEAGAKAGRQGAEAAGNAAAKRADGTPSGGGRVDGNGNANPNNGKADKPRAC